MSNTSILSEQEIQFMREGGSLWQEIRRELSSMIREGITGKQIDDRARELFRDKKLEPAFYEYDGFPGYICVSVNDCIIHGVGDDVPFKSGDKVTLDVGFRYNGICIDSAFTLVVDPDNHRPYVSFVSKCEKALWVAIRKAKEIVESGQTLFNGDIAHAIESYIKDLQSDTNYKNLHLIDGYVGHTIGKNVHQKPHIFNKGLMPRTGDIIHPNTVICIEPMILNQGNGEHRKVLNNKFNIYSKKPGVFTCHIEHMVLIKNNSVEVLTASSEELSSFLS